MKLKILGLIILVFKFSSIHLFASENVKTLLLVSDIDDTIKVSHVLNTAAKIGRASDVS